MRHVATLVAGSGYALERALLQRMVTELSLSHVQACWRNTQAAVDLSFDADPSSAWPQRFRDVLLGLPVDVCVQPEALRTKRLLLADMDSTMIENECIDELADKVGLKAQVAAITERAMRGEMDFAQALIQRVALLKGLSVEVVDDLLSDVISPTAGADTLVRSFAATGGHTCLVSGGFTVFTQPIAARLGFAETVANELDVTAGVFTGTVAMPIVDAQTKAQVLQDRAQNMGLELTQSVALGDGSNDVPMLKLAGLSIAYRAKPAAKAAATAWIDHGDLSAAWHFLGLSPAGDIFQL